MGLFHFGMALCRREEPAEDEGRHGGRVRDLRITGGSRRGEALDQIGPGDTHTSKWTVPDCNWPVLSSQKNRRSKAPRCWKNASRPEGCSSPTLAGSSAATWQHQGNHPERNRSDCCAQRTFRKAHFKIWLTEGAPVRAYRQRGGPICVFR